MKGIKITLTEQQTEWLVKHFKNTENERVAEHLGVSLRTAIRKARELGLSKTPQFMRKMQRRAADRANESNIRNGTYPPKGFKIPNREVGQFKAGESNKDRMSPKRFKAMMDRSHAKRAETFKEEKLRYHWGLEPRTRLNVHETPKWVIQQRYRLRKRGYIVEGYTAYWTPETQRCRKIEAGKGTKGRTPFRFKEYTIGPQLNS